MNTALKNRKTVLFLGPTEIKGMITMNEAVEAIEQGYREATASFIAQTLSIRKFFNSFSY